MSVQSTKGTGVSARVSCLTFAATKCKAIKLSLERRSFERSLETIIRVANAHNSGGLSPGSAQFRLLREHADELCANFAQRWDISPDLLDAQIPAIRKLKSIADPPPKAEPAVLVSVGIAGAMALFFLMGVLAGLTSVGYHLIGGR